MRLFKLLPVFVLLLLVSCKEDRVPSPSELPEAGETFTNPILPSGPDPWVTQRDGMYYYLHTLGNRIILWEASQLMYLGHAYSKTIWTPTPNTPYSNNIWAPELHYIQGSWYVYFAADDGNDANHRMYVLENTSEYPMAGSWELKGKISDESDKWAIDGTVLEHGGEHYFIWSGWRGDNDPGVQQLYIARMTNPWTLEGERVLISEPEHEWEMNGLVNEGAAVLKNTDGDVFLTYSGSGCWTDDYAIGLLRLADGGDPLDPDDWIKSPEPVLSTHLENGAFGPGHNSFFKSPDGTEDWILYHANSFPGLGCGDSRSPRMQPFTWKEDGTPDFGEPAMIDSAMARPK